MPNVPPVSGPPEPDENEAARRRLGETLSLEGTGIEVQWDTSTYDGEAVDPGTDDTLLLKSQADRLYDGGGAGAGGIKVIQLDAPSNGSITETLPVPNGQSIVVVRVDNNTGATATIEDPNGNNIVWPGRDNAKSFEISPLTSFLLTGDTASTPQWYVENPAVYEIGSFVPGNASDGRIMLRHKVEHDLRVEGITVDAESDANNDVVLRVKNSGTTITNNGVTVSGGTSSASKTFSERIPAGNVLKVLCKDNDSGLADVSLTVDAIRD